MSEVVTQYQKGDKLKMKEKVIKARGLRGKGMEYVTVEKVWVSRTNGEVSYDIKSHTGADIKLIPHGAFEFLKAKPVE